MRLIITAICNSDEVVSMRGVMSEVGVLVTVSYVKVTC